LQGLSASIIAVKSFALAPLVILLCLQGNAQTAQMLPEIDTNVNLSSDLRVSFQAKDTREAGAPEQAEIGPSLDFYLKPLIRLQNATEFDLDDAKPRPLVFSVGYRYMPQANNAAAINRMEPVVTFHVPLQARFLLSDKNRADLDWQSHGVIATALRSKKRSLSVPITLHRTPASSSSTRANMVNGVTLQSMLAVPFLSANTWNLSPTTSTRTIPAKVRISS
jgi:hypothetical protein